MDSWKDVYRERHQKDAIVRVLLEEMVEDSRNRIRHIDGIAGVGMVHARDVLENIITGRNGEQRDLARIYYARKSLKRLRRGWVLDQWRAYRSNQQSFPIWQGCGLMAMFSDHELELADIDHQLQDMANEFMEKFPLSQITDPGPSPTLLSSVRYQEERGLEPTKDIFSRHYEDQVERLQHLVGFFTKEKGFKGNTDNYYDPFNSFIDKVIARRVGIPITLCIVFAELAQRVGIAGVELMGFPQHFMIRYRPSALKVEPEESSPTASTTPPTYYLDLFYPSHRVLTTEEYEDHFSRLNIPRPADAYRDLPTPPLEIFLRCLRNIILAVEHTGGAGRMGSDHQTSLYSGITQLLTLHPSEEWGLYVLWLKYLSSFWPEDIGFIRTSIEDMELMEHRRSVARNNMAPLSPPQSTGGPKAYYTSTHETIKILRTQARELEMTDEAGDVGHIRRRKRPKVATLTPEHVESPSLSSPGSGRHSGGSTIVNQSETQYSPSIPASSPTIGSHFNHAYHQIERQSSISGEQQHEMNGPPATGTDHDLYEGLSNLTSTFTSNERRRPEPRYYVGEVFRHLIYRYTGVIYGYDLRCEADERWISSMGIDLLQHGRHQPFYNALLSDGSRRYVAQENIQVLFRELRNPDPLTTTADQTPTLSDGSQDSSTTPASSTATVTSTSSITPETPSDSQEPSAHPTTMAPGTFTSANPQSSELGPLGIEAVGQYFEAWDGQSGHYIMNKELRKVYPTEDYQYSSDASN
ncbi:hypothetical protein BGX34_008744 [Mortierella sp. NVP85]|nr:hypothetical protein BGX34_008744 [Mortierella sp. NVP85]